MGYAIVYGYLWWSRMLAFLFGLATYLLMWILIRNCVTVRLRDGWINPPTTPS